MNAQPVQLPLFPNDAWSASVQEDNGMIALISGSVYAEGDHYCATINGGWWSAMGKTEKDAISKVVSAYMSEVNA